MERPEGPSLSRRDMMGLGMLAAAGALGHRLEAAFPMGGTSLAQNPGDGESTPMPDVAAIAKDVGGGEPLTLLDLDALDNNIEIVLEKTQKLGWAIRPALKVFHDPHVSAYVLERLPEPRGMFFHLRGLEELLQLADEDEFPNGADLMSGYVPTFGELERYFSQDGSGEPPHTVRWMVDDPDLLEHCAELATSTDRETPVEVAFEFDAGIQRGGITGTERLDEMISLLRDYEDVLELTGLMCYDGIATLESDMAFRQSVADEAQRRFRHFVDYLREEASDIYDHENTIRNGPGSSNYQQWDEDGVVTEFSPGTAFTYGGYLTGSGFDNEGLVHTLYHAAPVMRIPATGQRLPFHDVKLPDAINTEMDEIAIKGGAWPSNDGHVADLLWPEGLSEQPLSSGRGNNASELLAPPGELELGDYVLLRPHNAGDGIGYFGSVHAIRDGNLVAVWPTDRRW